MPPKAHTHTPILARSGLEAAVELANSITESVDSTTDSVIISRLSLLNMFNILNPLESGDGTGDYWSRPTANRGTIGVGSIQTSNNICEFANRLRVIDLSELD